MKAGWKLFPLSELIAVQSGFAFKSAEYSDSGHFLMRIGNVQDGYVTSDNPKFVRLNKRTAPFELCDGDILTSLTGNIGRVGKVESKHLPAALNQRVARISVKRTELISPEYLYHFLSSQLFRDHLGDAGHGAAQQNVSPKEIGAISLYLPPLDEQRRIVAVLDKAFAGIAAATANAQKNLTNARALFESTLSEIYDRQGSAWPQFPLSEAGKTITGNTPKTGDKENFGDFLPFIKPGNFLSDGSISYDGDGLSEKGAQASRIIPAGSALMVCIGATIGKSGYTERKITANQQINAVIPKSGIVGKFLYYQFLTPSFQRSVRDGSGQATLPIISKSKWSELRVRLPNSEKEQTVAVKTLDEISDRSHQLQDLGRRKLAALSELKQSLLQKAFAGELT